MSDAKVRFFTLDWEAATAASAQCFSFNCPKHDRRCENLIIAGRTDLKRDGQGQNGGIAQWDWDGNVETPTFHPSVNCGSCWHGFIVAGRCITTNKADEPEIARAHT